MAKIYQVFHSYDVDGGFGDAVEREELIASFENKADADAVVERYSYPHVYDSPYADLMMGLLYVTEVEIIPHAEFDLDSFESRFSWTTGYAEAQRVAGIKEEWDMFASEICDCWSDENGCITTEYDNYESGISYPVGTPVAEIEKWFDENYPGGLSALTNRSKEE